MPPESRPVFRFAPSPNGWLHLGHALSAILNFEAAQRAGGRFLLRIEDIDATRARPEFVEGIFTDLNWLGLRWEEPVRRQAQHMGDYAAALERLKARNLVYPCFCSRADIQRAVDGKSSRPPTLWPRDPDGALLYPRTCRDIADAARRIDAGETPAWRLDMTRALAALGSAPTWREQSDTGEARIDADARAWGDVIVARRDIGTSYHLAVVMDDAAQGVTHVIRGRDLYHATSVHRVLQMLLDLPEPVYAHHRLVLDAQGDKLSKSSKSTALRAWRAEGATPGDVRRLIGLPAD